VSPDTGRNEAVLWVSDCNCNGIPDADEIAVDPSLDCDGNGIIDDCELLADPSLDCTGTGRLDSCDIADGLFIDCNGDNIPDVCQKPMASGFNDCNKNGIPDDCEIAQGFAEDCNGNGVPDECDLFNPIIEVVFVVDTSNSNADEVQIICDTMAGIDADLNTFGLTYSTEVFGVLNTINPAFDACVTQFVASSLGSEVQNFAPCCRFITSEEDLGAAVAQVAQNYPWQTQALRVVIVFGDEGPRGGNPCNDPGDDRDAATGMINIAQANGVRVLPVMTRGYTDCVLDLMQETADETRGELFIADTAGPPLRDRLLDSLLALATATDVNFNEIPDECDIASGVLTDCNNNRIPDVFELNNDLAPDCDGDELLDECQFPLVFIDSGELPELDASVIHSVAIPAAPVAMGDVSIRFRASGDLNALTEAVVVRINGQVVGTVYSSGAFDCAFTPDLAELIIPEAIFNDLLDGGDAVVTLSPTPAVDSDACPTSFIQAIVEYRPIVDDGDCNGNGIPDICELVQFGGTLADDNFNFIPDECEGEPCDPDVSGDGVVNLADLNAVLANFGQNSPNGDTNGDGAVNLADLNTVLAAFGTSCP